MDWGDKFDEASKKFPEPSQTEVDMSSRILKYFVADTVKSIHMPRYEMAVGSKGQLQAVPYRIEFLDNSFADVIFYQTSKEETLPSGIQVTKIGGVE